MTKWCRKCGVDKPLSHFNKRSQASDKLHSWCVVCKREYERMYRVKNPERMRAKRRRYVDKERQMAAESLATVRAMRGQDGR